MKILAALSLALLLSACGGTPPPADWKMNAVSLLEHAQQRWLEGDSKAAEPALAKARGEIAKSGRIDLLARAELAACAAHVASLDFSACTGFDKVAADAASADLAYARFLNGDWNGLDPAALPAHYAGLLGAKDAASAHRAAAGIDEPLPRLIAAALLLRREQATPETLALALETAAERGWRRPLLAWLQVTRQRALTSGDHAAAALLQRRIDFVLGQTGTP